MRIYISGPADGKKDQNKDNFEAAETALREMGHETFNPAREGDISRDFKGFYEACQRAYFAQDMLKICLWADGLFVLDGWNESNGALAEVALAKRLGIPIYSEWNWKAQQTTLFVGFKHIDELREAK